MWVVYREQNGVNHRMYWCGNGDWSSVPQWRAACWSDRRDAYAVADELVDTRPGPVDAPYVYGEEYVGDMPRGNPKQILPKDQVTHRPSRANKGR